MSLQIFKWLSATAVAFLAAIQINPAEAQYDRGFGWMQPGHPGASNWILVYTSAPAITEYPPDYKLRFSVNRKGCLAEQKVTTKHGHRYVYHIRVC